MRSAFHPERVLHPVQLRPDEYDGFIVYGLSKFITSHVVKGNMFLMYTLLFGMVGILCSLEGLASSSTTGNYSVFFALWVVGYACMGTLWPILCIVFKQWLPDDCTPSSSY